MTDAEVSALLESAGTAILTTLGGDGFPHSTAMWFLPRGDSLLMWTYGKSQKAVNLTRDPRCAVLVEEGEGYSELRGVLIRTEARILTDFDQVAEIGKDLYLRYTEPRTGIAYEEGPRLEVERQARKRIGLEIPLDRVSSWDHSKL